METAYIVLNHTTVLPMYCTSKSSFIAAYEREWAENDLLGECWLKLRLMTRLGVVAALPNDRNIWLGRRDPMRGQAIKWKTPLTLVWRLLTVDHTLSDVLNVAMYEYSSDDLEVTPEGRVEVVTHNYHESDGYTSRVRMKYWQLLYSGKFH